MTEKNSSRPIEDDPQEIVTSSEWDRKIWYTPDPQNPDRDDKLAYLNFSNRSGH